MRWRRLSLACPGVLAACILGAAAAVLSLQLAMKRELKEKDISNVSNYLHETRWWYGKYPPDFEIDLLNNERFVLSEHIGKEIIILNFFTTWCSPCAEEMPELEEFCRRHGGNIRFVAIDVEEKREKAVVFCAEKKVSVPVGVDENGEIAKRYGVRSYPTTVLIGTDGRVALYECGAIANAEVAFGSLLPENEDRLKRNAGITGDAYLAAVNNQARFPRDEDWSRPVRLEGKARELAERMRCPCRGEPVSRCRCGECVEIRRRLGSMKLAGRGDGDILKELFMKKPAGKGP